MLDFDILRLDDIEPIAEFMDCLESIASPEELMTLDETKLTPGSDMYKKARKKRQNRESARRSRARKQNEFEIVQSQLQKVTEINNQLSVENVSLKSENETLKKDLEYFKGLVSKPKGNSKLLVTTTAFTIACIFMILQGETTGNKPQIGNRTLKSFPTDEPELGGLWFMFCFFVAILSGVFYMGGLIRGNK